MPDFVTIRDEKSMFLLSMGCNPDARHINCWSDVSGCQQQGDDLCWAIVVHTDGGEPVPRTASLQHLSAAATGLFFYLETIKQMINEVAPCMQ